jgi:hypothetical protein
MTASGAPFGNPLLVSSSLVTILEQMLGDTRAAYRDCATWALDGLADKTLLGVRVSSGRHWITLRDHRARPVAVSIGAVFQCMVNHDPPQGAWDMPGWIVVQDGYRGGALVLAHELGHFANRYVVWRRQQESADLVDASSGAGLGERPIRATRAHFLNELAARHLAYLAETGTDPTCTPMPAPGALFACAVTIASYPEVYADCGVMQRLLARGDDALLRDQVGAWMPGLRDFAFFAAGTTRCEAHARWLETEIEVGRQGRRAPVVAAEGTL